MEYIIPYSQEAEVAFLGGLFLNPSGLAAAKSELSPSDFYFPEHIELYRAMLIVGVDVVSLTDYLKKKDKLDIVGGVDGIGEIIKNVHTSAGTKRYIKIIKTHAAKRKIMQVCSHVVDVAASEDLGDVLSTLKGLVKDVQGSDTPELADSQTLLSDVYAEIERRSKEKDFEVGIPTGFTGIDDCIGGLEQKTLTYIIARPSVGKTALALSIAENIAKLDRGVVLFFSLEMGDRQITRRRLAAKSNVFLSRIRHGNVEDGQWDQLLKAANQLASSNMLIVDKPKYKTIENLLALSESIAIEQKVSCVFVDHIQLIRSRQKFNSRHLEISFISNSLKDLSKDLNIPVIGLCQLNREVEKRTNKRPQLYDLKESGDLEQDADIVIGIYREDREATIMELGGLKGRDVGTWKAELDFDRFTQRII